MQAVNQLVQANQDSAPSIVEQIGPQGPITRQISDKLTWSGPHRQLGQPMLDRLQELHRDFTTGVIPLHPDYVMLRQRASWELCEPVLAFSLNKMFWPDFANQTLWEKAIYQLSAYLDVYRDLLGEFLSPALIEDTTFHMACHSYRGIDVRYPSHVDDMRVYLRQRERRMRDKPEILGFSCGIESLDKALSGISGMTFLAGPAGIGKTDLAIEICCSVLASPQEIDVVFFELDIDKSRVYDRFACNCGKITESEWLAANPSAELLKRRQEAHEKLSQFANRLHVLTLDQGELFEHGNVVKRLAQIRQKNGNRRLLVVIDYVQLISFEDGSGDQLEQDRRRMSLLADIRVATARGDVDQDDAYLVLSEIRKIDKDRDLTIDDLLGSSRQQFTADNVLMIQNRNDDSATAETSPVIIRVVKSRRGYRCDIPLTFCFRRHSFVKAADTLELGDGTYRRLPKRRV